MENLEEGDIQLLKENVEKKFGRKIQYAKDCAELSASVFDATNCKVSETTLKRLYNLVNSSFNPSKYTLNSLSSYIGYKSLDDFITHKDDFKKSAENLLVWTLLKEEAISCSKKTLLSAKNQLGISFDKLIQRQDIFDLAKEFMESDKPGCALVSPSGFGKSAAMMQIADNYIKGSENDNNILWYFDCQTPRPKDTGSELSELTAKVLGNSNITLKEYFEKHPATLNGKVIMMFDNVNSEKTAEFVCDLIYEYRNEGFMKVMMSTRTLIWQSICKKIKEINKECWFRPDWVIKSSIYSNIRRLTYEESLKLLKNCDKFTIRNFELLNKFKPKQILQQPNLLELLIATSKDNLTEIDLYSEFSNRKIYTTENGFKSQKLIDFILFTTNYGLDTNTTEKKRLSRLIDEYGEQLNDFLNIGILGEYYVTDRLGERSANIKFNNSQYFDYQLANYWLKEFGLNENMLIEVSAYYSENTEMLTRLFEWFIKYAFKAQNMDMLSNMFNLIELHIQNEEYRDRLKQAYCTEFRYYPDMQKKLLKTRAESQYYILNYMDVDNIGGFMHDYLNDYYNNASTSTEKLTALTFMMYDSFLNSDEEKCAQIYSMAEELELNSGDESQYMLMLSLQVLYFQLENKKLDTKLLRHIQEFGSEYYSNITSNIGSLHKVSFALIDTLVKTDNFESAKMLIEKVLQQETFNWKKYHPCLDLIYALSLKKLNLNKKADQYFEQGISQIVDNLPDNAFVYTMLRVSCIAYYFNKSEVFKKFGKYFADHFKYKYYYKLLK